MLFVVVTLTIVIRVTANQTKAASSFYIGGAQFSGKQNGFAIAGDYLSAASFLGIVGAALFTWIGQITGMYKEGEYAGFFGAVIGSLIVLGIWRMVAKK